MVFIFVERGSPICGEVACSPSNAILTTRSRSDAMCSVTRAVVENLKRKGLIQAGLRDGYLTTELLITDIGRSVICEKGK